MIVRRGKLDNNLNNNLKENLYKLEEEFNRLTSAMRAKKNLKDLNANNTAIILVDIQEKLAPAMKNQLRSIKNTRILLKMAELLKIPVIVTEQYPKGLGLTINDIKEVLPSNHKIFEKISFSAMRDNTISDYIIGLEKRNYILVGMEAHICVYQTAKDLLAKGYNVLIPREAVDSRTDENLNSGLELIKGNGGEITNTETLIFELLERAGTEEFKILSALIK